MEHSKEYIDRVAKAHRSFGLTFRYLNRKGKQYVIIGTGNRQFRTSTYWNSYAGLNAHVTHIFPGAYCTSGMWGRGRFDCTFRIN